jgi:hypothetical protein
MIQQAITILNTALDSTGKFAQSYCLGELRADGEGRKVPYAYTASGEFRTVDIDSGSVTYWRMDSPASFEDIAPKYSAKRLVQGDFSLRLVVISHRSDAFEPTRLSNDLASLLIAQDSDIESAVSADSVTLAITSIDHDTPAIYATEFSGIDVEDLDYRLFMLALTIKMTIVAPAECWANECDLDPDILHWFNFCDSATFERLTDEQRECLTARLCETPPTLCEQLAEVAPEDVVADVFDCLTPEAQAALLEAECEVTPCDPVTVEINGTEVGTPASGSTFSIKVTLDGNESGSWNGVNTWEVESEPCADGTITINGDSYGTVPSGGTENIQVVTDATPSSPVGSLVSGQWVIGNAHMNINGTNVGNIEAEGTANQYVKVNGTQIGSWNNPTQTWNIVVKQGGVQVGSNVGNEWIVPACPATYSLSLATSSATPAYGGSFTITATATGFTPTSYTFSYPSDSIGGYARTTQAGNALAITARGYSTQTIMVTATDGVTTVGATIQVTVAQMTEVTDFLTNTGIVDATITGAVRTLALRLDDYGIWSKVRALYPFVGGTATTHKYNLKDPRDLDAAYRLVFAGGWTHDANGVTGNGVNTSADSKLANNVLGQNSLTLGVYNRTSGLGGMEWSGSVTPRTWLAGNISGTAYFDLNNGASTATTTAPADVRGTLMASRVVSTATELNLNGQGQRTTAATSSAPAATNFILGQFSGGGFTTSRNYAAAWLTDGLNAEEETHFRSVMQTFQTTLSRQV